MSKRMARFRKMMVLMSMSGAFVFPFWWGGVGEFGCAGDNIRNADLVTFYQGAGDASIEAFRDSTANIIGSDFDAIVLTPAAGFITAWWDNTVDRSFPLDPDVNTVWRE